MLACTYCIVIESKTHLSNVLHYTNYGCTYR